MYPTWTIRAARSRAARIKPKTSTSAAIAQRLRAEDLQPPRTRRERRPLGCQTFGAAITRRPPCPHQLFPHCSNWQCRIVSDNVRAVADVSATPTSSKRSPTAGYFGCSLLGYLLPARSPTILTCSWHPSYSFRDEVCWIYITGSILGMGSIVVRDGSDRGGGGQCGSDNRMAAWARMHASLIHRSAHGRRCPVAHSPALGPWRSRMPMPTSLPCS